MDKPKQLVRAAALALKINGLKSHTAYKMARENKIPCYKTGAKGRGVLFDPEEVLAAMKKG